MMELRFELDKLPDIKAEPLTDSEKRIFLAAMGRERGICEKVDAENTNEPEAVNLVRVCNNIEKKVRAALWTEPAASFPQRHENDHFADGDKKGDLVSRQFMYSLGATCLAKRNDDGELVAITGIRYLPSAQPIRCKDCRHSVDYYHDGDCYCSNPKWGLKYFGGSWEFYCADAERRTDEMQ